MRRLLTVVLAASLVGIWTPAGAHLAPFSYVDVQIEPAALDLTLVAHIYDLAHELGVDPVDRLLDVDALSAREPALAELLKKRLRIVLDGQPQPEQPWSVVESLPDRQSVRLHARYPLENVPAVLSVEGVLFPYDPQHQTFVNVYARDSLALQAILDREAATLDYFTGARQGRLAVVGRFLPEGIYHILIGPDHLLFLVGLLLLGGSIRRLVLLVSAFTLAHSVTLALAALNVFSPSARIIEPTIALSIVYVGADNLLVRGGRDVRTWIALAFGLIHGFGFANVLRGMQLPAGAVGWSLFSFNLGVEIGQLVVVVVVASVLATLRARSEKVGHQLAVAGSLAVIVAGAFWFIERAFFPGGMA